MWLCFKVFVEMAINGSTEQKFDFGSPEINGMVGMVLFAESHMSSPSMSSPSKRSPVRWSLAGGSPVRLSLAGGSPVRWSLAGGSPVRLSLAGGSPVRLSLAGGSPSKIYIRRTIQKNSESPQKEKFIERHFVCSPSMEAKSAKALDPLKEFSKNLVNDKVFTPSPQPPVQSLSPIIGTGSFFSVRNGISPKTVEKTAKIGSNQDAILDPESMSSACMTKKDMLELLNALRISHGNPQVAKTLEMYFSHVSKDNGNLALIQEKCRPLPQNMDGLLGLMQCVIALYRAGLPISDVKPANFMVTVEGRIVCVDLDLRKQKKGLYKLVASGEYTHTIGFNVSEQFKQLLLVFLETLGHPIVGDRKPAFRGLYEEKGLLQCYELLSSDRSVSETTLDDFRKVLQNIRLSDEDITYLVGLITPSAFSQ
jgi:hypothetical protein